VKEYRFNIKKYFDSYLEGKIDHFFFTKKVPELTGFWLLTLMVEAPLSVFLMVIVWMPDISSKLPISNLIPMQFALQLVHAIFVYLELIFGFFALRVLARYQISRFHYKQFDDNNKNRHENQKSENLNWLQTLNYNSKYKEIKVSVIYLYSTIIIKLI
jgi:hypothetical protein